jgi:hypothetical protein
VYVLALIQAKYKWTKARQEMVECSGGMTIHEINNKITNWVGDVIDVAKGKGNVGLCMFTCKYMCLFVFIYLFFLFFWFVSSGFFGGLFLV